MTVPIDKPRYPVCPVQVTKSFSRTLRGWHATKAIRISSRTGRATSRVTAAPCQRHLSPPRAAGAEGRWWCPIGRSVARTSAWAGCTRWSRRPTWPLALTRTRKRWQCSRAEYVRRWSTVSACPCPGSARCSSWSHCPRWSRLSSPGRCCIGCRRNGRRPTAERTIERCTRRTDGCRTDCCAYAARRDQLLIPSRSSRNRRARSPRVPRSREVDMLGSSCAASRSRVQASRETMCNNALYKVF